MTDYNTFSKFYDAVMGDRTMTVERVEQLIQKYRPDAKSLLEVACGTGALLKLFADKYRVSGLDLSTGMLEVAKKEAPQAKLYKRNMTNFALPEKFDIILCLFDSLNHLLALEDWKKFFTRAREHLTDTGVLIFDINTEKKLARAISEPAYVRSFGDNLMVMSVANTGEGIANWNVKIFEHIKDNQYLLHEENIRETAFPNEEVTNLTKSLFHSVEVIDFDGAHPKKMGERLHFVCRK